MHPGTALGARLRRCLPLIMLWMTPALAHAQCVCAGGDGVFTTHTAITIDGVFNDWPAVLADGDNNSCDGGAPNTQPQPDRDAPVQSTGRDLIHFAYTWDNTHVQTYTERMASSKNVQRFIYYADTDNDGLMETGERVIVASWKGSNRKVNLYLGYYLESSPGGDSMVDGSNYADGYTLPGTITNIPSQGSPHYSGTWGQNGGVYMEWEIPWTDSPGAPGLGIPPGSAFTFHVSSTNSQPQAGSFPAQADDNMAGCGGGPGGTGYAGLLFQPDRTLSGSSGSTLCAAHTLTNLGNQTDSFDLTSVVSGSHTPTVSHYHDVDSDGTLSAGDTLLTDTTGDGTPDTGPMAASATISLLVCYATAPADTGTALVTTTATSDFDSRIDGTVTDTVTLSPGYVDLSVTKVVATISDPVHGVSPVAKAIPGGIMEYTIAVENQGNTAADSAVVVDAIPANSKLYVGNLGGAGSGPVTFQDGSPSSGLAYSFVNLGSGADDLAFSNDNGVSFGYAPTPDVDGFDPAVTHIRITPTGSMGGSTVTPPNFALVFRVGIR